MAPCSAGDAVRLVQEQPADALAAYVAADRHPPEPGQMPLDEQAAGAHDLPVALGHQLLGLVVAPVAVGLLVHPLLDAEHLVAQGQGALQLGLVAGRADGDRGLSGRNGGCPGPGRPRWGSCPA